MARLLAALRLALCRFCQQRQGPWLFGSGKGPLAAAAPAGGELAIQPFFALRAGPGRALAPWPQLSRCRSASNARARSRSRRSSIQISGQHWSNGSSPARRTRFSLRRKLAIPAESSRFLRCVASIRWRARVRRIMLRFRRGICRKARGAARPRGLRQGLRRGRSRARGHGGSWQSGSHPETA